ncbi:unnamed protein product [Rodentolepis nana]|uniref:Transmembrane protein n=1 Tax=Rodentolepis nana TaxID=102285 RepID=A0A0R3TQH9_RODNA|nr:unnamed protein product [Rodentolepis nana]
MKIVPQCTDVIYDILLVLTFVKLTSAVIFVSYVCFWLQIITFHSWLFDFNNGRVA